VSLNTYSATSSTLSTFILYLYLYFIHKADWQVSSKMHCWLVNSVYRKYYSPRFCSRLWKFKGCIEPWSQYLQTTELGYKKSSGFAEGWREEEGQDTRILFPIGCACSWYKLDGKFIPNFNRQNWWKRLLRRPKHKWEENIKMDAWEYRPLAGCCEQGNELPSFKKLEFLDQLSNSWLLKKDSLP
jgi:hypothetical protein